MVLFQSKLMLKTHQVTTNNKQAFISSHTNNSINKTKIISVVPRSSHLPSLLKSVPHFSHKQSPKKQNKNPIFPNFHSSSSSMAETSTSCYSGNGILMTHMNSDHLYSILFLLPVDSIISFAMTCKKFRSLSTSNTLWESICKRDWGLACVEALKKSSSSFGRNDGFEWMKIYKQVKKLNSVSCQRLLAHHDESDGDSLLFPGPRASHSLNFVCGCLVLFGGGCEGGRHLDDTWVAYIGNDFHRILKWQKISTGCPSGRFGHTCIEVRDSIVLFGGINDNGLRQNDTWIGQITRHETVGITLSWRLLDVGLIKPPARGAHAVCSIGNKMVIHGGIGLFALRLNDTWVLDLSDNHSSGTWREIVSHSSPAARSGHTLTCICPNTAVLFAGRGVGYDVLADIWLFHMDDRYENWVQIVYDLQNIPGGVSLPRVGHSATLILGGRVLIHGGEDSYRHRKDDFWVLDINTTQLLKSQSNNTCNNLKGSYETSAMWKMLKSKGYAPKGRSFHRACIDCCGRYLYISGGMVDGPLQPADATGLRFDDDIFLVELSLQF